MVPPQGPPGSWQPPTQGQYGAPTQPSYTHGYPPGGYPQGPQGQPPKKSYGWLIGLIIGGVLLLTTCGVGFILFAVKQAKEKEEKAMAEAEAFRKKAELEAEEETKKALEGFGKKDPGGLLGGTDDDDEDGPQGGLGTPLLTQRYATSNKLAQIRYPASFAAKTINEYAILVSHNLDNGYDEVVSFTAIPVPISNETSEFARVINNAEAKGYAGYRESSQRVTTCGGTFGAKEFTGTWVPVGTTMQYTRVACFFVKHGHGYGFSFTAPTTSWAKSEPTLRAIASSAAFQ